jgi:glutaredoxin|tara:strand:- start:310 stop:561 length:252 start_codon:yes stop_codon:yes gene_type:complete
VSDDATPRMLTVFSSPLCGPCERMKAWLTEHDYPFVVRDVMMDEEAGELLEAHDIRSTPALQVGDRFVVGLDIAAMEQALADW